MPPADIPWDLKAAQTMGRGANGGVVREIGVAPKPSSSHIHRSSSRSISASLRFAGVHGTVYSRSCRPVNDQLESFLFAVDHDEANTAKRNLEPGEAHEAVTPEAMHERGLMWIGSPATVRRQVEQPLERFPLKYAPAWQYNGVTPRPAIARSLRLFADEVVAKL